MRISTRPPRHDSGGEPWPSHSVIASIVNRPFIASVIPPSGNNGSTKLDAQTVEHVNADYIERMIRYYHEQTRSLRRLLGPGMLVDRLDTDRRIADNEFWLKRWKERTPCGFSKDSR